MTKKIFIQKLKHTLSVPFIYAVLFPVLILDIITEIYHRICFPLYGIPTLKRKKYIKVDRHRLSYLDFRARLNCMYCGYMNGFALYFKDICKETENYWCAIKHKEDREGFVQPDHHKKYRKYGKLPKKGEHPFRLDKKNKK